MKLIKIKDNSQPNYLRFLFICICIIRVNFCIAQEQDLMYLNYSDSIQSQVKEQHANRLNNYKREGRNISIYEKIYEIRTDNIKKAFLNKSFIYDSLLYDCINNCLQKISKFNQTIENKNYTILVNNSPVANAYSIGGGTIILNLGLLRKIRSHGELAFIISHEIGHDFKQDVDITSYRTLERLNSKEFKNIIDHIDKEKYNRKEKLETFLKSLYLMEMTFSRKQEIAADSLALNLMLNANYHYTYSFNSLSLLDSIDFYKFPEINYQSTLGFEDYPFKEKWMTAESKLFTMSASNDEENRDALKSHPDISQRVANLKFIIKDKVDTTKTYVKQTDQLEFKSGIDLDLAFIDSWETKNDYGRALFFSLKQLQEQPNNEYLLTRISNLFDKIYEAQKSHELNKFVESPGPHQEASYKEFLTFLSKIRLSELELLIYHFHLKYKQLMKEDTNFTDRLNKYKSITR